jgi:hypothetical protein
MTKCTFLDSYRLAAKAGSLAIILATASLLNSDAWPLNCAQLNSVEIDAAINEAFGRSDIVFLGDPASIESEYGPTDVQVAAYWKGPNLATIPMKRSFWKSEQRVIFATRSAVGGWLDTGPECVVVSSDEMKQRLSRLFGRPIEPSPDNREGYELLIVGSIFLLSGFMAVGVWVAIRRLSGDNKLKIGCPLLADSRPSRHGFPAV